MPRIPSTRLAMKELQSGTMLLNRWGLLLVNHGPALNVLDFVWGVGGFN